MALQQAVGGGIALSASAPPMAQVAQWQPPSTGGGACHEASCKTGGCGGGIDLRALQRPGDDFGRELCVGIDFGTQRIRAGVWVEKEDAEAEMDLSMFNGTGCTGMVIEDPKALEKWLKTKKKNQKHTLPKGLVLQASTDLSNDQTKKGKTVLVGIKKLFVNEKKEALSDFEQSEWVSLVDAKADDGEEPLSPVHLKLTFKSEEGGKDKEIVVAPEELLALVLLGVRGRCLKQYDMEPTSVVVAVPAGFSDRQRVLVQAACYRAGLAPRRLVSAPLAALMGACEAPAAATGGGKKKNKKKAAAAAAAPLLQAAGGGPGGEAALAALCRSAPPGGRPLVGLVVGMGAGGAEAAAVEVTAEEEALPPPPAAEEGAGGGAPGGGGRAEEEEEVYTHLAYRVLGAAAGSGGGGDAVDARVRAALRHRNGEPAPALQECRKLREALSGAAASPRGGPPPLAREELVAALGPAVEGARAAAGRALGALGVAGRAPTDIDFVLAFGGMAHTPAFQAMAESFAPSSDRLFIAGTDAACRGATYLFASLEGAAGTGGRPVPALEVLPHALRLVEGEGKGGEGEELFPAGAALPAAAEREFRGDNTHETLRVVQQITGGGSVAAYAGDHPQVVPDDARGDTWRAKWARVRFQVDESGVLRVEKIDGDRSRPRAPVSLAGWLTRIFLGLMVIGLAGKYIYEKTVIEPARHAAYLARLTFFYEQVNPEKVHTLDELLLKSKGKEDILIRKLEMKYDSKVPTLEEIGILREEILVQQRAQDEHIAEEVSLDADDSKVKEDL